jgi:hypothetical protein
MERNVIYCTNELTYIEWLLLNANSLYISYKTTYFQNILLKWFLIRFSLFTYLHVIFLNFYKADLASHWKLTWARDDIHSWVKSISTLRYFPIYFIVNHLFSTHSPEVIPCLIFMKFELLFTSIYDLNININSRRHNFLWSYSKIWWKKSNFVFKSCHKEKYK